MVVADPKTADSGGLERKERTQDDRQFCLFKVPPLIQATQATDRPTRPTLLKKLTKI